MGLNKVLILFIQFTYLSPFLLQFEDTSGH